MNSAPGDYFTYLPDALVSDIYPCTATAAGFTRIRPNTPYPPQRHPLDHHFTWSDGRILHAWQIVYIPQGEGTFESGKSHRRHRIEPGSIFLLFPDEWHRYAPDTKTGWVEHWLECKGAAFSEAQRLGIIRPEKPVLRVGINRELMDAFELCHRWARRASPGRAAALATLGLHLLAILEHIDAAAAGPPSRIELLVRSAQRIITERFQEPLDMRELARSLSVSYSWLRQRFKDHTGVSLKQFQLQIRLQRAQHLLVNTDRTVKEIASILGFDSPFHLSAQFKARTGTSPSEWRQHWGAARGRPGEE